MKKSTGKTRGIKALPLLLALVLTVSLLSGAALAVSKPSVSAASGSVTFSNLQTTGCAEFSIVDSQGNPAKVGIERVSGTRSTNTWRVWYGGVFISAEFYMDVTNNVVSSVYNKSVTVIGGTYSNAYLSRSATVGRLDFDVSIIGVISGACWLRGTVTGSNNEVTVDWSM